MDEHSIAERIEKIASGVAAENGVELVHVDILGTKRDLIVRIYIDKPGSVSIDDCSVFSRGVEAILDDEDFIPSMYVLEVSSPGIERELYSLIDFAKFAGSAAKVKFNAEIDGRKTFVGKIIGVEEDEIVFEDRTRGAMRFKFEDVDRANLKIDLAQEFRKH